MLTGCDGGKDGVNSRSHGPNAFENICDTLRMTRNGISESARARSVKKPGMDRPFQKSVVVFQMIDWFGPTAPADGIGEIEAGGTADETEF